MRVNNQSFFKAIIMAAVLVFSITQAWAGEPTKVVIQVSSSDPVTQNLALNNVVNLQKHYGIDNVKVELVAYGPGLSLLTPKSKEKARVESLAMQDVTFSACGNTIRKVEKKTGKKVVLDKGVGVVPGGLIRIIDLQAQGYHYIRP